MAFSNTKLPILNEPRVSKRGSGSSLLLLSSHFRARRRQPSEGRPSIVVQEYDDPLREEEKEELDEDSTHLSCASHLRRSSTLDLNETLGSSKPTARSRRNDQRSLRRQLARDRLRRAFCLALLVVQWLKYVYHRAGENILGLMSVSQLDDEPGLFQGHELMFDPHVFRAQREGRFPVDARKILETESKKRTVEQLKYLRIALRGLKEFGEYPVTIQQKVSSCVLIKDFNVRPGQDTGIPK